MRKKILRESDIYRIVGKIINETSLVTEQKKPPYPIPFKNNEEGNRFRAWVNKHYPKYAKNMNYNKPGQPVRVLDPKGGYNNSYIKRAWSDAGFAYDKFVLSKEKTKEKDTTKPPPYPIPFKNNEEGDLFRQWVNKYYKQYAQNMNFNKPGERKMELSPKGGKEGYKNKYIKRAWNDLGHDYHQKVLRKPGMVEKLKKWWQTPSTPKQVKPTGGDGFGIAIAFPDYQPMLNQGPLRSVLSDKEGSIYKTMKYIKGDDYKPGSVGKLGHGGIALINKDGETYLYEFGRYKGGSQSEFCAWFKSTVEGKKAVAKYERKHGKKFPCTLDATGYKNVGVVKGKYIGRVAEIENGKITNLDYVLKKVKARSEGEGPNLSINTVTLKNINFDASKKYATQFKTRAYELTDADTRDEGANCGTFALQVLAAGGANVPHYCSPYPNASIKSLIGNKDMIDNRKG